LTQHAKDARRSDVLNMRIDPKLKYLADVAASYKGKTLSEFIEDALRHALTSEAMLDDEATPGTAFVSKQALPIWNEGLWDEDEATRLFNLAVFDPDLLRGARKKLWISVCSSMAKSNTKFTLRNFVEYYKER
jgi:Protein of unknown function (DUF1778)